MRVLQRVVLSAGLVLAGLSGAAAADPVGKAKPSSPAPEEPEFGGWYLRGDTGVAMGKLSSVASSFDTGFALPGFSRDGNSLGRAAIVGAGVGYQFNSWFRADLTGEWRSGQKYRADASYDDLACRRDRCTAAAGATVQTNGLFLANAYLDLGTWSGITPYVGGGIGAASTRFGALTLTGEDAFGARYGSAPARSDWSLAWALMAGADIAVSPSVSIDVGYRYANLGDVRSGAIACDAPSTCGDEVHHADLTSHDVRIGLRWKFGVPVAAAEPDAVTPKVSKP